MRLIRFCLLSLTLTPWIMFLVGCGGTSERSDTRQDERVQSRTEDRVENRN